MMKQLEEVKEAFYKWRQLKAQGINVSNKIPDDLWSMAGDLLKSYGPTFICKALGINHHQFKKHYSNESFGASRASEGFLEASVLLMPQAQRCELFLEGEKRTLRLKVSEQQLPLACSLLQAYL